MPILVMAIWCTETRMLLTLYRFDYAGETIQSSVLFGVMNMSRVLLPLSRLIV